MSPDVPPARTAIGATLREARRRYGLEVREVEERTKIRARYIRALENEDWETLPAPAYVRGFLRTYGQMLGLDGEMLADEYRRRFGDGPAGPAGGAEPLLSERRRVGDRQPPSRGLIVGGVIAGILVLILILGLLPGGGDDDEPVSPPTSGKAAKANGAGGDGEGKAGSGAGREPRDEPVDAVLVAKSAVSVCLVGDGDDALIDGQQLQPGDREEYGGYKTYRLDLGPGEVDFKVGSKEETIAVDDQMSVEGDAEGIREIEFRGPDCP
jgi:cytoskeleton protein RodZ